MTSPQTLYHLTGGVLHRYGRDSQPPPPPPPPPPSASQRYPGDPGPPIPGVQHRMYWGCSTDLNGGSPAAHELAAGVPVGINRRYWSNATNDLAVPNGALLVAVRDAHAKGRLPVVSTKVNWASAAAGGYDSVFDGAIAAIESYPDPTDFIIGHEPEDDWKNVYGSNATQAQKDSWTAAQAPLWRQTQQRFRARMNVYGAAHGGIKRLSFGSCLMSFTWASGSQRNPEDWWAGPGVHDWVAADHYAEANQSVNRAQLQAYIAWCKAKGVTMAIGEFGLRPDDPNGVAKMNDFYNLMVSLDTAFISYFDSNEGGTTGWRLTNTNGLLDRFRQLMRDPRSLHMSDLGYP